MDSVWIQFRRSEISFIVLQKCVAILMVYGAALFSAILIVEAIESIDPLIVTFGL